MKKKKAEKPGFYKYVLGPFFSALFSLALGFGGQYQFFIKHNVTAGIIYFIIASVLFISADIINRKAKSGREEEKIPSPVSGLEITAVLAITAVAFYLRFRGLDSLPFGFFRDEAQNGLNAIKLVNGEIFPQQKTKLPVYITQQTQNAAMFIYMISAVIKFFGAGVAQVRAVEAAIGAMCVPAFYFIIRKKMGPAPAVLGAIMLAAMFWHLLFSRIAFHAMLALFIVMLFFYFAYRAYAERGWLDFVMLGVTSALAQYTYQPARLAIPVVFFLGIYILFRDRGFYSKNWKKIILAAGVFMIVFFPMFRYIAKNHKMYTARFNQTFILNENVLKYFYRGEFTKAGLYLHNLKSYAKMFNIRGPQYSRDNVPHRPMLDFVTGALFVLGFVFALYRMASPFAGFTIIAFIIFLHAGIMAIEAPHSLRSLLVIPFVLIFVLMILGRLLEYFSTQFGKNPAKFVFFPLLIALALYSASLNYRTYFKDWANNHASWASFSPDEYMAAQKLKEMGPAWKGIYNLYDPNFNTVQFILYPRKDFIRFNPEQHIPIRDNRGMNYVYCLSYYYVPVLPSLQWMYPDGKWEIKYNKFRKGDPIMLFYEVTADSIRKFNSKKYINGLTGYYYSNGNFEGKYEYTRRDPFILFWELPAWNRAQFHVRWKGKILAEKSGEYTFYIITNSRTKLEIGGRILIDKDIKQGQRREKAESKIYLKKGMHSIDFMHSQGARALRLQFSWKTPGSQKEEIVPVNCLFAE